MPRFFGAVGYGFSVEQAPGVYEDVVTERSLYGEVIENSRRLQDGERVNDNLTVGNSISVLADAYALEHFFAIRYVNWAGTLWEVSDVKVQRPRLLLRLGGVYNGPKAQPPSPA